MMYGLGDVPVPINPDAIPPTPPTGIRLYDLFIIPSRILCPAGLGEFCNGGGVGINAIAISAAVWIGLIVLIGSRK